ncbi:MAG: PilN domain-containing protein [Candidatus Hydrothermales bacterium]
MIKINLLPPEEKIEKRFRITLPPIGIYEIAGILILSFSVIWIFINFSASKAKIAMLRAQIKRDSTELYALREVQEKVKELEMKKSDFENKVNIAKRLLSSINTEVMILDEFSKALPDFVWITSFQHTGSIIRIEGGSFSNLFIADFIQNLKSSPLFGEEIILERIDVKKETETEYLTFTLQVPVTGYFGIFSEGGK